MLDKDTLELLDYCAIPRTSREISAYLGISSKTDLQRRFLTPLQRTGKLMRIGTGNATKYVTIHLSFKI